MKYLFILITFITFGVSASTYTGTITKVYIGPAYGNIAVVFVQRNSVLSPSCSGTSESNYGFYFDADTPGGKLLASAVLAAYVSKNTIGIQGSGACSPNSAYPGAELINLFKME